VLLSLSLAARRLQKRRGRARSRGTALMATEVDLSMDISMRPERKVPQELSRFEDPLNPRRPPALPRPRRGQWAPALPAPVEAPEVVVIGLGRQLRPSEAQGPRARLGAGAVEALAQRYDVRTYYDADVRGYLGTCRASLDMSGRAGVQKINMLQPMVDDTGDVGAALTRFMELPGKNNAIVLFVLSDWRLPFGQLRLRTAFNDSDERLCAAYQALTSDNQVACLHIGAGHEAAGEPLLEAEVGALPRVLANAATAIEVWLSEPDVGLVMRFINRPEVYALPAGWPYRAAIAAAPSSETDEAADSAELMAPADGADTADGGDSADGVDIADGADSDSDATLATVSSGGISQTYNMGSLMVPSEADSKQFTLYDSARDDPTKLPRCLLAPFSPESALAALEERPPNSEALVVAGRRFASMERLQNDLVEVLKNHEPGVHLRLEDDENLVKTLLTYHPDADQLLEELVAMKVDVSPIDDDTRCLWALKFDGFEEDVSLKTCLKGLRRVVHLDDSGDRGSIEAGRLGPGRWTGALRESINERALIQESMSRMAND